MAQNKSAMSYDAELSDCGSYRYLLSRVWNPILPRLTFIMLNPSKADALTDDPTIRKCIGFAKHNDFGSILVVNLFAFRATKPADLYKQMAYTVQAAKGRHNDDHILRAVQESGTVVAAWGKPGKRSVAARADQVRRMVTETGAKLHCLRRNNDGSPAHPLMLPYSCKLEVF